MTDDKIRENRLRRMAERQQLALMKSRRRDPNALAFGTYGLYNPNTRALVLGDSQVLEGYGCDLDEIEDFLTKGAAFSGWEVEVEES